MATTQDLELLRRQLEELNAQMGDKRQTVNERSNERDSDRTHRRCEKDGAVGVKTASSGHDSRKPGPHALGKDFDDWDFTFNGLAGTLDPTCRN